MLSKLLMVQKQSAGARYRARIGFARSHGIYRMLFAESALTGANLLVHLAVACLRGAEGVSRLASLLKQISRIAEERSWLVQVMARFAQSPRVRIWHPCVSPRLLLVPAAARA